MSHTQAQLRSTEHRDRGRSQINDIPSLIYVLAEAIFSNPTFLGADFRARRYRTQFGWVGMVAEYWLDQL